MLSATVLSAAVLGACAGAAGQTGGVGGADAHVATPPSSSTSPTEDDGLDDAALCVAYGDVLTIAENADLGLADGRMEEQERHGWYQLATRVLGRLPSGGDSAVQTAIGELQEIAPAVAPGAYSESTGVRSPEWWEAEVDLAEACDALGAPLATSVFTGG